MGNWNIILAVPVLALLHSTSGNPHYGTGKTVCPPQPTGINSYRVAPGSRLYHAWNTVGGTAQDTLLKSISTSEGGFLDSSCSGYDVLGYDKQSPQLQESIFFGLSKEGNSGDLRHSMRPWLFSGDYYFRGHYDTQIHFGNNSHFHDYNNRHYSSPTSYQNVWYQSPAFKKIDSFTPSLKVLSWTAAEVVYYNCDSIDPDIRIYTTYIPNASSGIPYSIVDTLKRLGVHTDSLSWVKMDHESCVYPNAWDYPQLLAEIKSGH